MVVKTLHRAKKILDTDVAKFEALIRKCRTPEEIGQVLAAIKHYCTEMETAPDRYAVIMRDDDL
jgi:hypothetical protein